MKVVRTAMSRVKTHYNEFHADSQKKAWIYWPEYFDFWTKVIQERFNIQQGTSFLDLGCGRAGISSKLNKKYQFTRYVQVDPFTHIPTAIKMDAIEYLTSSGEQYDYILMKQVFHHIPKEKWDLFFSAVSKRLNKNGKLLLLNMPENIDIPFFKTIIESYQEEFICLKPTFDIAKKYSLNCEHKEHHFPVQISKEQFVASIREKYISTISKLSQQQIEIGIKQLELPDDLQFNDTLESFLFFKAAQE
jgi:SAM-dependent methyltransferase